MKLKGKVVSYCNLLGLELVGFTKCRRFDELRNFYEHRKIYGLENEFEEEDIEKRINPNHYMSKGKTIISIAFPYLYEESQNIDGFSLYTRGKDYHYVVNSYLQKICSLIEELGGEAKCFVDSNTLPERYIAYLCGIGFIGKNNLIITEKYGSYVFLGEIITDLEIENSTNRNFEDIKKFAECDICEECYNTCPTKSINRNKKNPNICMSYITQKKDIEDKFLNLMNGRIFGCDTCQISCPKNKDIKYSNLDEFKPLEFMNITNTEKILELTNGDFKETFKLTSCGWRGKNVIIRNALIRKANFENKDISKYKFSSEYIMKYKDKLAKEKEGSEKNNETKN
ncbi:epoxyqueuosine reductase [Clostridium cavendishii DSM 21758]|uniref:Epoxyqueuosine reductase n=1 Tax=Clostridium cavendishii DSM 21758 TaxID=1121302 RepID=A0A1M6MQP5_9CLOT|nr:tRNA epoxyqueuosine(34) reductase QueG [Clostridium cavendishii]SHJ85772.1 epoxyqueuosine reductase [Clostridium cavendishii DSM 21758]